jgi:hypothetical protein
MIEGDAAYGRNSLEEQRTVMYREIPRVIESRFEPIYPDRFVRVYDSIQRRSLSEEREQGRRKSRQVGRLTKTGGAAKPA